MMIEIWYNSTFFVIHLHRGEYTVSEWWGGVGGLAIAIFVFKTAQSHVLNALSHFQIWPSSAN